MTSKERFKRTCEYSSPDHPPVNSLIGQSVLWEKLYRYYDISVPGGFPAPDAPGTRFCGFGEETHEVFMRRVGQDFRVVSPTYTGPPEKINDDGSWIDMWGITYKWEPFQDGFYETAVGLPFAGIESVEELKNYPFPTADLYDYDTVPQICEKYKDYALIAGSPGCLDFINGVAFGRGVEQVLLDIALENPVYLFIVEKRFEFFYEHIKRVLEKAQGAIDIVHVGEDLGTQLGPIISPATFKKLHVPYYKRFFDMVHSYGAKTSMHSCGSVRDFIPIMIDMGLDILDVVQVDAVNMDLKSLHSEYYKKLMFSGTLSVQSLLPNATPSEIRDVVMETREMFRDGGIILGPSNIMQVDMPAENFEAMIEAIKAPINSK